MATTKPNRRRHSVRPPNPATEAAVPYYAHAGEVFEQWCGRRPSRNTLHKYARDGFPVRRGGPRVPMPTYVALKRIMTTREAMTRFMAKITEMERASEPLRSAAH